MVSDIYDPEPPITERDLDALQRRLGIELPPGYKKWLLQHNGGQPDPGTFHYKNESGAYTDSTVAWFLAVHDGPYANFEKSFDNLKISQRRLPANLIPIATDPFGNYIVLSIGGDDRGAVYFWDHEEEGPTAGYANCHLIADSFDDFIAGLGN